MIQEPIFYPNIIDVDTSSFNGSIWTAIEHVLIQLSQYCSFFIIICFSFNAHWQIWFFLILMSVHTARLSLSMNCLIGSVIIHSFLSSNRKRRSTEVYESKWQNRYRGERITNVYKTIPNSVESFLFFFFSLFTNMFCIQLTFPLETQFVLLFILLCTCVHFYLSLTFNYCTHANGYIHIYSWLIPYSECCITLLWMPMWSMTD